MNDFYHHEQVQNYGISIPIFITELFFVSKKLYFNYRHSLLGMKTFSIL